MPISPNASQVGVARAKSGRPSATPVLPAEPNADDPNRMASRTNNANRVNNGKAAERASNPRRRREDLAAPAKMPSTKPSANPPMMMNHPITVPR